MKKTRSLVLLALATACALAPCVAMAKKKPSSQSPAAKATNTGPLYERRSDAMAAAEEIAQRRGLDVQWVRHSIAGARFNAAVAKAIAPPAVGQPKNWAVYRSRFIDPVRIRAGVAFWRANRETLARAQELTGVPAAIVVGIVGVETIYGQQTGNFRVMDALCTLAFDFPSAHPKAAARAAFFRSELEEFLVLTQRTGTNPLALRGSYAGALGWPQFMPSSWSRYAVDFDGDGRIDLFNSPADVIGSVANYFKEFQWKRDIPTHFEVTLDPQKIDLAALLEPDILPTFTPDEFKARGALLEPAGQTHTGRLALIELQNGGNPPRYVAGTENFYAITRYNWSSYYAMAVIELGQEVAAAMPE
jgi:membrane-bound lytic murein transglycosylase B